MAWALTYYSSKAVEGLKGVIKLMPHASFFCQISKVET